VGKFAFGRPSVVDLLEALERAADMISASFDRCGERDVGTVVDARLGTFVTNDRVRNYPVTLDKQLQGLPRIA
jgi:hypothetical protein